jgi:hypothetical protein
MMPAALTPADENDPRGQLGLYAVILLGQEKGKKVVKPSGGVKTPTLNLIKPFLDRTPVYFILVITILNE